MNKPESHKHAVIRKLSIRRYRGLEALDWRPDPTLYALADDVWPRLELMVLPLINAILTAVERPAIEGLDRV